MYIILIGVNFLSQIALFFQLILSLFGFFFFSLWKDVVEVVTKSELNTGRNQARFLLVTLLLQFFSPSPVLLLHGILQILM